MPYLKIQSNLVLGDERRGALLASASKMVADALGKPERYVMVCLDDNRSMVLDGRDDPLAYLHLRSIALPEDRTAQLSEILCQFMADELGIRPDRVYIEFANAPRALWGWNGGTF
jgi:phenylpyruvate tautomerase